jgi:hypothetical protein
MLSKTLPEILMFCAITCSCMKHSSSANTRLEQRSAMGNTLQEEM